MDGIPHETVPFDWLGDGLPILILLLAAVWIVHRLRTRAASAAAARSLTRRGWKGFARRSRRGRSPA
jgi:flagellar biogenesis protein FliO